MHAKYINYNTYLYLMKMVQNQNQMGGDLSAKVIEEQISQVWESKSLETLQDMEKAIMEDLNKRRTAAKNEGRDEYDERLSDKQVEIRDKVSFFITKKENENDEVCIGDMFHTSWGYDQTNTEHFQVKEISPSGKTCKVQQIGSSTVKGSEGFMCEQVIPDPKVVIVEELCRVKIERHTKFNPIEQKHQEIGEIGLRGSVWYARGHDKHLQNLYRVSGSNYRSWYA